MDLAAVDKLSSNYIVAKGIRKDTGAPNAFGEMYHVALTAIWYYHEKSKELSIVFENCDSGRLLLKGLGVPFKELSSKGIHGKTRIHYCSPPHAKDLAIFLASANGQQVIASYAENVRKFGKPLDCEIAFLESLRTTDQKVLIWHRTASHKAFRNSTKSTTQELARLSRAAGYEPVAIGLEENLDQVYCLGNFWNDLSPQHTYIKQLWVLDFLFRECGVVAQIGMLSATLDGSAFLFGRKTCYLEREDRTESKRMKEFSEVLVSYRQIKFNPGKCCSVCPPSSLGGKANREISLWLNGLNS